ncbi:MAG TPA: glycosyl hydrolase [Edaphobacter sp.]|nr:glycosyl hydrolase [Edaphobacter sp.]
MFSCRALIGIGLLGVSSLAVGQSSAPRQDSIAALRAGFRIPPPEARLRCYWWWLNGNTDKPTITHDLEEMKAKGFGGALLVDANGASQNGNEAVPAGPKFGSPEWTALYIHALKEADRLGLEITLNITSGWNLGGPTVKPEDASKLLTFTIVPVEGGEPRDLAISQPPSKNGFYRDIAVLAYPLNHGRNFAPQVDPRPNRYNDEQLHKGGRDSSIRYRTAADEIGFSMPDTSSLLDDGLSTVFKNDPAYADATLSEVRILTLQPTGHIHVDLPAGEWEILRIGYTDSGALVSTSSDTWKGLAIDHLSQRAFNHYWEQNVEPLLVAAKPFHSLKYLATDSWELGGTNWTDDFRRQFIALRGYDPIPYLPIVAGRILQDRNNSTRFLNDLRRTVADLISTNHYDLFATRAKEYGLGVQAESGGPHGAPIDALETFRRSAVPQTEFWSENPHRRKDSERFFTKEAASAANIYGRRLVAQEGETSIGPQWSESLAGDLKPSFDMAITEGMNRLVWHEFASSPASTGLPGQEYFAGTHLNPKVTWWNAGRPFFNYLNRIQFLMQQGTPANDVLYFYGDHVPNFVRLKADDPAHVLPGFDYDVADEDALLHDLRIQGRYLVGPSGVRWRVFVLPTTRRVSIPVLQFVERYLQAGGSVVSLPPTSSIGNITQAQQQVFDAIVERIWNHCSEGASHTYSTGMLFCTANTHTALEAMNLLPDVKLLSSDLRLAASSTDCIDAVHRKLGDIDIYFIRSAYAEPKSFSIAFRVNRPAELWDPVNGEFHRATTISRKGGQTTLQLALPANGSIAVIFTDHATAPPQSQLVRAEPLVADWTLTFPENPAIQLRDLTSWTNLDTAKYFSGTATYHAVITAPSLRPRESACLSFTTVDEIATVMLNNKPQPSIWAPPYTSCFTDLRPGRNDVKIAVTNLWHNRLVGDAQPTNDRPTTRTNIKAPDPDAQLLPSGLIGAPKWLIFKNVGR